MRKLLALILLAGSCRAGARRRRSRRPSGPPSRSRHPILVRGPRQPIQRACRAWQQPADSPCRSDSCPVERRRNSGEHHSNFELRGRSGGGDQQPAAQVEFDRRQRRPGKRARASTMASSAASAAATSRPTSRPAMTRCAAPSATCAPTIRRRIAARRSSKPRRTAPKPICASSAGRSRPCSAIACRSSATRRTRALSRRSRIETRRTNWASWSTSHGATTAKYDWQDHRRRHRSLFHLGFYYDPFGWGYRPYQIGWRLWPSYYSSNYWINDPWQYRLPYAPPGYRWIRYYDDAILVDTWTGEVVDVIYNFFW